MTELSGILEGVGLPAIARFLAALKKTGCLQLGDQDWHADIFFRDGAITTAALGSRTGLAALEAMVEVFPGAQFNFDSQLGLDAPHEGHIELSQDEVLGHLDEAVARVQRGERRLPSLDAVPAATAPDTAGAEDAVPLDRGTLQTLLAVDGERTVREIVSQRETFDALWQLAHLADLGLIDLGHGYPRATAPTPPSTAPAEVPAPTEPSAPATAPAPVATAHCPRIGFEDDPSSSFGRPTRLHRCFATDTPLPLSLDQQRELCLTDQFATCPRLTGASDGPADEDTTRAPDPDAPTERLVRLPTPLRAAAAARAARLASTEPSEPATVPRRARLQPLPVTAPAARPTAAVAEPPAEEPHVPDESLARGPGPEAESTSHVADEPLEAGPEAARGRIGSIFGFGLAVVLIAAVTYVLAPHIVPLFAPEDTPQPQVVRVVATSVPAVDATTAPVAATRPTVAAVVTQPAPTAQPTSAPTTSVQAAEATQPSADRPPSAPLFDERFATNDANWPSNPQGVALVTNGTYQVAPRQAGKFAAISAPVANVPSDVVINATFRKVAGPPGGGYGIIVRDQSQAGLDGNTQDGHFYVLEAGDKGEVGIWRRDVDHWADLLPWQHSDAVNPGTAINDLTVRAVGSTLSLAVNGTVVATRTDSELTNGTAGIFIGGDGNQVAVSHFAIQNP